MSNCRHCGRPAGLLRSYHSECRSQFEQATRTIPIFFNKILQSDLPPDRFGVLLKEIAATCHIPPEHFHALAVDGIGSMLDGAIASRLPSITEEDRILDIAAALGISISEVPMLSDTFVKISVLRDLDAGKIPDRVTVVGPMPFELGARETIIWILNGVKTYRQDKTKESIAPANTPPASEMPAYVSPGTLGETPAPTTDLIQVGIGDLMITDQHMFLVSDDRHRQIPFSKVSGLVTFRDGFQITRGAADDRFLTFIVDDAWFASNLIARLIRLRSRARQNNEADAATSLAESE